VRCIKTILFILLLASQVESVGQVFPVQSTVQLTPPYSLYLSDYTAPGSERLRVTAFLIDATRPELNVRFRLRIEGNGIKIETKPEFMPPPVTLLGGVPLQLISSDLAAYFDPRNLNFTGITQREIEQRGALPEGLYQFCFEVLEYNRGVKISNTGCAVAWLILNDPPIVNVPADNEKIRIQDPQQVIFQWTPRHRGTPNSAFNAEYDFKLVEVWPSTRNPNDAILTSPVIFQTTTSETTIIYGPAETPLEPGRRYAFQLRAHAYAGADELSLFKNNGYSQVYTFVYGDACLPPKNISVSDVGTTRFNVSWDGASNQTTYSLRYRFANTGNWYTNQSLTPNVTVNSLQPNTRYEFQVNAGCGSFTSDYSSVTSVTTKDNPGIQYSCGVPLTPFNLDPSQLINSLKVGDVIKAGDFDVVLSKVSGSNGTFSGEGVIEVSYFNQAKVKAEFTNINVNNEMRMVNGYMNVTGAGVEVIPAGVMNLMDNLDEALAQADKALDEYEANLPQQFDENAAVTSTLITVPGTATVTPGSNGSVVIVDGNGKRTEVPAGTTASVVDSSGKGYIIDSKGKVHTTTAAIATATAMREYNLKIKFAEAQDQKFGFDAKRYDPIASTYTKVEDQYLSWKSVATGQLDKVVATLEGTGIDKSKIRFELNGAVANSQWSSGSSPVTNDQSTIDIVGSGDGVESELIALYPGDKKDQVLGKLSVITYDQIVKDLVIVPVNGNKYPYSEDALRAQLNKIYGQAVVKWNITFASNFDVPGIDPFDDGGSGLLSNYSPDMRKVVNAYKANLQPNTYYLFLVKNPKSSTLAGFMPRSKECGFIFVDKNGSEESIIRTMAHELGHGAFSLRHTFTEEKNTLPEKGTDNLMDYANGNKLFKYQWDRMRYPEIVMGLFEDDDDSKSEVKSHLFTITDEINLNDFDFGSQVNYVTPGGELIGLPKDVKVSFTGLTQDQQINSTIAKGTLLGFRKEGISYGAVLTFSNADKTWKFKGYKDYNSDRYYPQVNISESSSTKKVLIGREGTGCGLSLIIGNFNGKEHDKVLEVYLQSLNLSSEVLVKEIQVPDCDRFKTESATYFFVQAKNIHGVEQITKFRQIATLIDALGNDWYKEFREAKNEVIRKPGYRYVSLLNSSAKPEDFDYFLKSIAKYKEAKDEKFEKLIQIADPDALSEICSVLTPADYKNLSLDHRKHILSTLAKDGMYDHYLFANNEEGVALRVLKSVSTPTDSKEILDYLEKTTINKTVLIKLLNNRIDDAFLMGLVGDKNYTELMKVISRLITTSSDYTTRIDDLVLAFNKRLMVWGITQESVGAIRIEDIEFNDNGKISSTRKELISIRYEDGPSRYGEFSIVRKEDWSDLESPELSPFDLIIFVNKTDLSAVNFATESATGQHVIVPAIYLPFAEQKDWNSTVNSLIINTADIAVILSSGGTAAVASGISKARRAWLAFEAINAAANLTINLSGVANDPKMKDAVEIYNSVTMVLAIGELSYGGVKKLSAIMDQAKALPSVKNLFNTQLEKLASALNKVDVSSLSPTSRKAYDRMLGLVDEVKGVGGLAKYSKIRSYLGDGRIKAYLNNQQLSEFEDLLKTANDDVLKIMDEFKSVDEFAEMVRGYKDGLKTMPDGTIISDGFASAIKNVETFSGSQGWLRFWKLTPKMEASLNTITQLKTGNKLYDVGNATEIQLASIHAYTTNGDFINQPFRYQPTWFGEYNTRAVNHINEGLDELRKLPSRKVVNEKVYSGKTFAKADFENKFVGKVNTEHPYKGYMSTSKLESVAEGFIELTKKWAIGSGEKIAVIQRVTSKNGVYIDDISDWGKNLGRANHSDAISKVQIQEEVLLNSQKLKQVSEPIPLIENGLQKTIDGMKVYYVDFVEIL